MDIHSIDWEAMPWEPVREGVARKARVRPQRVFLPKSDRPSPLQELQLSAHVRRSRNVGRFLETDLDQPMRSTRQCQT